jgi:hypothetical protein
VPKIPKIPSTKQLSVLPKPSGGLSDAILKQLKHSSATPFLKKKWKNLEATQPEIARFINASSYSLAPDDPEEREKIASGMLSLYILLLNAKLQDDVMRTLGQSLEQYFSKKS